MSEGQDIIELKSTIDKLKQDKNIFQQKIFKIENEIQNRNEMLHLLEKKVNLNLVINCVKNIDIENIITNDEIEVIYDGMDKTDYRIDCGDKYDRWFDLNKLINKIINLKNKYKDLNLILKNVTKLMSEDRLPPINTYNLQFVSDKDIIVFYL